MFVQVIRRRLAGLQCGWRGVVGLAMIASYILANVGYPVWEPAIAKESSEPFPCQFTACGCRTAAQCRSNCCCRPKGLNKATCCSATTGDATNWEGEAPAEPRSGAAQRLGRSLALPKIGEAGKLRFVIAIEAAKCRGTGVEWIQAGFVAVAPRVVVWQESPQQALVENQVLPSYLPPVPGRILRPV